MVDTEKTLSNIKEYLEQYDCVYVKKHPTADQEDSILHKIDTPFEYLDRKTPVEFFFNKEVTLSYILSTSIKYAEKTVNLLKLIAWNSKYLEWHTEYSRLEQIIIREHKLLRNDDLVWAELK